MLRGGRLSSVAWACVRTNIGMFVIHADALEQQLFIANNGPNTPELREKQKQLQQQRGKQMQAFTRRHALGDVSNQRRGTPVPHQPQKMVQKAAF